MSPKYEFLPHRLRNARVLTGLSQKELGERVKMSHSSVSAYETGMATPPPTTLKAIAEVLGREPGYFLMDGDIIERLTRIEAKLDRILSANDHQRRK